MTSATEESYVVPAELDGARLDKAAARLAHGLSVARVKRAIEDGHVRVDGRHQAKGEPVRTGQTITIAQGRFRTPTRPPSPSPRRRSTSASESPSVLVVEKPAGQQTAPLRAGERGTLANALVGRFPELRGVGYGPREPGLVHRLDKGTSGLVVVARSSGAFDILRAALKDGRLEKKYLLVCDSESLPDDGTIAHPLANHPKDQRRVMACIHPRDVMRYSPREATTRYRVLRRGDLHALVEAVAPRALRHQIRVHFASIEHPLVGDELYGSKEPMPSGRHALHASHVCPSKATATWAPSPWTSPRPPSSLRAPLTGCPRREGTGRSGETREGEKRTGRSRRFGRKRRGEGWRPICFRSRACPFFSPPSLPFPIFLIFQSSPLFFAGRRSWTTRRRSPRAGRRSLGEGRPSLGARR